MSRPSHILVRAINYDHTLVLAIELSNKSWVLAAQVPGLRRTKAQRTIEPNRNALLAAIDGYRARAAAVGYKVDRVITTYEAGWSGFWLARWLVAQGVEVHVVQPSSVPVDRRLDLSLTGGAAQADARHRLESTGSTVRPRLSLTGKKAPVVAAAIAREIAAF
jgi:hypothetical protein